MDICCCFLYLTFVSCSILLFFTLIICSNTRYRYIIPYFVNIKSYHSSWAGGNMSFLQPIMEKIRPILVGVKGWNYCVFWKLSEDQRFLELMDCCCAGSENKVVNNMNGEAGDEEELLFTVVSINNPCRDIMFQHPTTKACQLLSHLPSSLPLDSGIHAQALISNQPRWLNFSNSCHSEIMQEDAVETRVLIPVSVGLIELFVDKQVSEDQRLIDFITSQFNISQDQQSIIMTSDFSFKPTSIISGNDQKIQKELFQPPVSPATMIQNLNLQDDISTDQIHLHNSSMNFFQQFDDHHMENENKSLLESPDEQLNVDHRPLNAYDQEDLDTFQKSMINNASGASVNTQIINTNVEPTKSKKRQSDDRDSMNRSDSVSDDEDINDDEDNNDGKYRRRTGKGGTQCKNLEAERKRRKKLNERLYHLRSLVPKITKLDRASILGDAIEYVLELKQQVEDLQNELERNVDDEGGQPNDNDQSTLQSEVVHGSEVKIGTKSELGKPYNRANNVGASSSIGTEVSTKKNVNSESTTDKVQQMEPQVEVIQLDGNELFVKVFCEHKPGGFVKLMEALNSLGLEVTNVNVTSLLSLVLNVFKVERKDCDMIQADHVKESLLELTRNPNRSWPEISKAATSDNGNGNDHHNYHPYHHHQHPLHFHHNHHLHHLHN